MATNETPGTAPCELPQDQKIRAALDRHWAASDANDFETEHSIYHDEAVLEYPQSGERIRGRPNIQITRSKQPSKKRFAVRRIRGGKVIRETQYFADPFEAGAWRAQWVERMHS